MSYLLTDLILDRVDLVDEGANSEAFVQLYKRKEQTMDLKEILSKMKPEHAEVIQAEIAKGTDLELITAELEKAKADLSAAEQKIADKEAEDAKASTECEKAAIDEVETLVKSAPAAVQELISKMKLQKETAEDELRKARDSESNSVAIAKAAELKSLPIDNAKLVDVLKRCDTDMVDMLTAINTAIDSTVLKEAGASTITKSTETWSKIEKMATDIAARDSVTVAKATSTVLKEHPELYKEYLEGGAN